MAGHHLRRDAGAGALAGIENGEPQRTMIVEQRAEELRTDPAAAVLLIFHDQESVIGLRIESPFMSFMTTLRPLRCRSQCRAPDVVVRRGNQATNSLRNCHQRRAGSADRSRLSRPPSAAAGGSSIRNASR